MNIFSSRSPKRAASSKPGDRITTSSGHTAAWGVLAPAEYANQQAGAPPEQAQGSAARPLLHPPHLGQNINPGLYS
jgi:hypothetical protein